MNARTCGSCTFCCKVMSVAELAKPVGEWCAHCQPGKGCGIYAERPGECRTFVCQWLADPRLPDLLRPDKVKVMLTGDGRGGMVARCDPQAPLAWRHEPMLTLLKGAARQTWNSNRTIVVKAGARTWLVAPAAEYDLGALDPGAQISVSKRPNGTADVKVVSGRPAAERMRAPTAAPRPIGP